METPLAMLFTSFYGPTPNESEQVWMTDLIIIIVLADCVRSECARFRARKNKIICVRVKRRLVRLEDNYYLNTYSRNVQQHGTFYERSRKELGQWNAATVADVGCVPCWWFIKRSLRLFRKGIFIQFTGTHCLKPHSFNSFESALKLLHDSIHKHTQWLRWKST